MLRVGIKFNIHRNAASLSAHLLHGINCNAPIYVARYTPDIDPDTKTMPFQMMMMMSQPKIVGVSWWFPPDSTMELQSWTVWTQDWLLSFRQFLSNIRYLGRGGLNLHRYRIWKSLQKDTHDEVWTNPRGYYFCNVIAVDSGMRGMGVGKMLMDMVTKRADAEGVPCYLESSKGMPNLKIYEKMGFSLLTEIECVDEGESCKVSTFQQCHGQRLTSIVVLHGQTGEGVDCKSRTVEQEMSIYNTLQPSILMPALSQARRLLYC